MGASNIRFDKLWVINENARLKQQANFENTTSSESRKLKGQFFTPYKIAEELTEYALKICDKKTSISCLEPAFGTGVFYSALQKKSHNDINVLAYEIDNHLINNAHQVWSNNDKLSLINRDFITAPVIQSVDLLITNPPYIRHQSIDSDLKFKSIELLNNEFGIKLSGLSDLYCYFILSAHKWLKSDAKACWLLPSEFMDVKYGKLIKEYLLKKVTLLRIHRYDPLDVQFDDALITSCVVWYTNKTTDIDYEVTFTYGGTHSSPKVKKNIRKSELLKEEKWTRFPQKDIRENKSNYSIGDFFKVKRGLATGDNKFFIIDKNQIDRLNFNSAYLQPILPSPRYLEVDEIISDTEGIPINLKNSLFLINCQFDESIIIQTYPELWTYLMSGIETTAKAYLCKSRKKWYFQENREAAPLLCTYMGRGNKAMRFIKNESLAIVTNSYLMLYPNDKLKVALEKDNSLLDKIWISLNEINPKKIDDEGRVYGGGLKKIEPKELLKVECDNLISL